ncbi:uncharacterized protein LOC135940742 isoform X2 [Cloeon dipterum]|uniref:uncharacterized protein LOC135940742 isoform X2 n=1 Tax=Cloeon dipterum TaxID=197152 RepID=UPI00321F6880
MAKSSVASASHEPSSISGSAKDDLEVMEVWVKTMASIFAKTFSLDTKVVRALCEGDIQEAEQLPPNIKNIYESIYQLLPCYMEGKEFLRSGDMDRKDPDSFFSKRGALLKMAQIDKLDASINWLDDIIPYDFSDESQETKRGIKFMEYMILKYRKKKRQSKKLTQGLGNAYNNTFECFQSEFDTSAEE